MSNGTRGNLFVKECEECRDMEGEDAGGVYITGMGVCELVGGVAEWRESECGMEWEGEYRSDMVVELGLTH